MSTAGPLAPISARTLHVAIQNEDRGYSTYKSTYSPNHIFDACTLGVVGLFRAIFA
jgi:hypothetical protein